jgi:2-oxoglutarate ferredoxin oxidoreductase subunit delta
MIYIDEEMCKGCRICTEFCPTRVLADSTNLNKRGYYPPVVEKKEECHGCRLCELLCPEFAICIVNE